MTVVAQDIIESIVNSDCDDVFAFLGMHLLGNSGPLAVTAFLPGADRVDVVDSKTAKIVASLERIHPEGLFAAKIGRRRKPFAYQLQAHYGDHSEIIDDPYRFPTVLDDTNRYLFCEGTNEQAYDWLGAHIVDVEGVTGALFVVWAPAARRVSLVGDFNHWDGRRHVMRRHPSSGLWEIFLPGVGVDARYKYEIRDAEGELLPLKADPYAFAMEQPPATASVVQGGGDYGWGDAAWMSERHKRQQTGAPISIYEVHLGSWRRVGEEGNRYLSYREMAEQLVPYVQGLGFTHIEVLPITEYPFDGSWGYQPIGLFAPTSRFGSPDELKYLIDRCHQAGIGVIMDWVPGHFPTDTHGLGQFDGTSLYEHQDMRQGFHPDWNTLIYNYGRKEVLNYLLSNALFWLERYHLDGLRVDAVASMLYLDYSREEGEWIPNAQGGRENLEALDFLKNLNSRVYGNHPGVITIAEESTSWPGVSQPTWSGGLGFGFKWNMGWMNDTLRYVARDPVHRSHHHDEITFGLTYAFSENFVLPLSHDEVVHGKGSLLSKMPGDDWQQRANLRAYYAFMWTHPGKKLLFMGGEIAQRVEWNHDTSLDWHLLDSPAHAGIHRLIGDLNRLYRTIPALYELDSEPEGFEWLIADAADSCVFAYARKGSPGAAPVIVVSNFSPLPREGFRLGVPWQGFYRECLNTDGAIYGGSNAGNKGGLSTEATAIHGHSCSLTLTLPPLATVVFERSEG